jgi:hypothetical protein
MRPGNFNLHERTGVPAVKRIFARWSVAAMVMLVGMTGCAPAHQDGLKLESDGDVQNIMLHETLVHATRSDVRHLELVKSSPDEKPLAVTWQEHSDDGKSQNYFAVASDDGYVVRKADMSLALRNLGIKDPGLKKSTVHREALGGARELYVIQFKTQVLRQYVEELKAAGAEMLSFVPQQAYLVRLAPDVARQVKEKSFVAGLVAVESEQKLASELLTHKVPGTRRYIIKVFSERDVAECHSLLQKYHDPRSSVIREGLLLEGDFDQKVLGYIARAACVESIEPASTIEYDMDQVRVYGGADYLSSMKFLDGDHHFAGIGIVGHVVEGIEPTHADFLNNEFRRTPIAVGNAQPNAHGHATYGIIFGSGSGNTQARGLLPYGQGVYSDFEKMMDLENGSTVRGSRIELTGRVIDDFNVMFQTASWGHTVTTDYTARSQEMDQLTFMYDIPVTQSQSNEGTRSSRPQAWAKNVISVGGVFHQGSLDPKDHHWNGGASIGPAPDGRIKPDLVAFADQILTTQLGGGYREFGGTSGATPIVAGHVGLAIEMWTSGFMPVKLPYPLHMIFENRPHSMTVKALLINTASQYLFEGEEHDLTRTHQGWGVPNLKTMFDRKSDMLIVNEDVPLINLGKKEYAYEVAADSQELKITMVYRDPPSTLIASIQRVNNLDLKVIAPDGTVYYGNHGLNEGDFSLPAGGPDALNTVENVFINKPMAGNWQIEVSAAEINADGNLATSEIDSNFALVVSTGKHP